MNPIVSDHAIDRFLERVSGNDGDRNAAQAIIAGLTIQGVRLGAASVYAGGFTFCLKGQVVTTVFRGRHRHVEQQSAWCRRRLAERACA